MNTYQYKKYSRMGGATCTRTCCRKPHSADESGGGAAADAAAAACVECVEVPLTLARAASDLWPLLRELAAIANENCISDLQARCLTSRHVRTHSPSHAH